MKTINVVAAIIHRGEEILSTQRGYGEYEGWWEFPGGKIESRGGAEARDNGGTGCGDSGGESALHGGV